jgi:hypothetical protein
MYTNKDMVLNKAEVNSYTAIGIQSELSRRLYTVWAIPPSLYSLSYPAITI